MDERPYVKQIWSQNYYFPAVPWRLNDIMLSTGPDVRKWVLVVVVVVKVVVKVVFCKW